jgi:hypothetical protein
MHVEGTVGSFECISNALALDINIGQLLIIHLYGKVEAHLTREGHGD